MAQGMAFSLGPILEYNTYYYNYHTLQQLITLNNIIAIISTLEAGESQEKYPIHSC